MVTAGSESQLGIKERRAGRRRARAGELIWNNHFRNNKANNMGMDGSVPSSLVRGWVG